MDFTSLKTWFAIAGALAISGFLVFLSLDAISNNSSRDTLRQIERQNEEFMRKLEESR
jgi:hypothetical protein